MNSGYMWMDSAEANNAVCTVLMGAENYSKSLNNEPPLALLVISSCPETLPTPFNVLLGVTEQGQTSGTEVGDGHSNSAPGEALLAMRDQEGTQLVPNFTCSLGRGLGVEVGDGDRGWGHSSLP